MYSCSKPITTKNTCVIPKDIIPKAISHVHIYDCVMTSLENSQRQLALRARNCGVWTSVQRLVDDRRLMFLSWCTSCALVPVAFFFSLMPCYVWRTSVDRWCQSCNVWRYNCMTKTFPIDLLINYLHAWNWRQHQAAEKTCKRQLNFALLLS